MPIARLLEGYDLSTVHTLLCLLGVGVSLYLMQLKSREEGHLDPAWVEWGHRFSIVALALAFLWSLLYSMARSWQPWPPMLAIYAAIIGMMIFRAVTIHLRVMREIRLRESELHEGVHHFPRFANARDR